MDRKTIIWVTYPSKLIFELVREFKFKALIYEIMDDCAKIFPHMEKELKEIEAQFINEADLIITTSAVLAQNVRRINKNTEVILAGNGVEYDFFSSFTNQAERPAELKGMNKIVGYIGTIADWIDIETICFLADSRKDIDFVFIGPSTIDHPIARKNIHFLGMKDYPLMPSYCSSFDVCLIPFKAGELADSINPVKLYEYFSMGKPVIAYKMKELMPYKDMLYMANGKQDFLKLTEMALLENDDSLKLRRMQIAKLNDWSVKAAILQEALLRL